MIDYEEMFRGAMQARAMVANPDQWADSDRDQVNTRHYLSTSMRVALDRGEFFLVYQPIIRLADNRIIGAEALLRWEHPTLGTLLPGRFIDRAENNGLMVPLTAFVLEQACRHVRSWRDHSTDPQPFVSVNVSASAIPASWCWSKVCSAKPACPPMPCSSNWPRTRALAETRRR